MNKQLKEVFPKLKIIIDSDMPEDTIYLLDKEPAKYRLNENTGEWELLESEESFPDLMMKLSNEQT